MHARLNRAGVLLVLVLSVVYGCTGPILDAARPGAASAGDAGSVRDTGLLSVSNSTDAEPDAIVIYSQPARTSGGVLPSSWHDPDGSENDRSVWENFGFEGAQTISEVRWRGAYDPAREGTGSRAHDFTVGIYASIPAGSEPDLAVAPLAHYRVGGNAGETPSEVLGGLQTYDYRFTLPLPFEAKAATTYWLQIEAFQGGNPDWGLSIGSGTLGDGRHFRGTADGYYYQLILGDAAIELLAPVVEGVVPVAEVAVSLEDIAAMLADLPPAEEVPVNADGVQEVMLVVSRSGYTPVHFSVKAGTPVRVVFRQLGYVPGGNELFIRWGERQQTYLILSSASDKKVLDFTPEEPGEFRFSCPHDWYEGVMTVVE